jgi:uncharacterized protein (TIGR03067 family)
VEKAREEPAVAVNAASLRDLKALQGRWEQLSLEIDGVVNPPDDLSPPGGVTTFTGDRFAVHDPDGALLLEGTFTLDASTDPKQVNWTDAIGPDAGKTLPAIYRLEGDHFVFIAADAGAPRPAEFRTGPGQIMRIFARR